jgi:hypothetical protein
LHGQHDTRRSILHASRRPDAFGSLDSLLHPTAETPIALHDELARLRSAAKDRDARLELPTFQLGELTAPR